VTQRGASFAFCLSHLAHPISGDAQVCTLLFRDDERNIPMSTSAKATRIQLLDFHSPQMRAFHMSWIAFFFCFFAWFGIAPLMAVVRDELKLDKNQVGWCIIGSVAITIFARLFIGWLCDQIGPRLAYSGLLIFGSIPVMAIGS
jgi:NNP family nitrate/nitrite transporter-like MFS transporter